MGLVRSVLRGRMTMPERGCSTNTGQISDRAEQAIPLVPVHGSVSAVRTGYHLLDPHLFGIGGILYPVYHYPRSHFLYFRESPWALYAVIVTTADQRSVEWERRPFLCVVPGTTFRH